VNGGSGQWKRLRSRTGHALDDDDDDEISFKYISSSIAKIEITI